MKKIGLLGKIWRLSRPKGSFLWKQALRTIILMIIAGFLAKLTGFQEGLKPIIIITLFASLILDVSIPFKKLTYLGFLGAIITVLAFFSVFLSASSLPIFILFTILWSFFYIFYVYFWLHLWDNRLYIFLSYFLTAILLKIKQHLLNG